MKHGSLGRAVHARCGVLSRVNSAAIHAPCVLASPPPVAPDRRVVIPNPSLSSNLGRRFLRGGGASLYRKPFVTLVTALAVVAFAACGVLTADAANPPSFTAVVNPLDHIPAGGYLSATSCPSANSCVAVGEDAGGQPFVLAGDPSTWSTAQAKAITLGNSFGTTSYLRNSLDSVTCSSSTSCVAVGSDRNDEPVVVSGNPATWRAAQVREIALSAPGKYSYLDAVACTSSTWCVAVGRVRGEPLVLAGDPSTWGAAQAREIKLGDAFGTGHGNYLNAVTCSSSTACVAVGEDGNAQPLVLAGNPSTWGAAQAKEIALGNSLGTPDYPAANSLHSVTCSSPTSCVAVGEDANVQPLVLAGNPSTWGVAQAQEITLDKATFGGVGPYAGEGHNSLYSVTCSSSTSCIAVGEDGNRQLLQLTGDPSTWGAGQAREITLGDAFGAPYDFGSLNAIACSSSASCVAVGGDGNAQPLVLAGDPGTWDAAQATERTLGGVAFGVYARPSALACAGAGSCFDVGWDFRNDFGPSIQQGPYLVHGSPAHWDKATATLMPQLPGPLVAISCASSSSCVALGAAGWELGRSSQARRPSGSFQAQDSGGQGLLILTGDPSTWGTAQGRTIDLTTAFGASALVTSGTCISTTYCAAIGLAFDDYGNGTPFVIAGDPSTMTAANASEITVGLNSVACAAPMQCVAVGSGPIVLTGDPATWGSAQPQEIRLGKRIGPYHSLDSVACPSPTYCVAVGAGGWRNKIMPLVLAGNPLTWNAHSAFRLRVSPATTATVKGFSTASTHTYQLTSVSCRSVTYCVAAGTGPYGAALYITGNPAYWKGRLLARPAETRPLFREALVTTAACIPTGCYAGGFANGGDFVATLK